MAIYYSVYSNASGSVFASGGAVSNGEKISLLGDASMEKLSDRDYDLLTTGTESGNPRIILSALGSRRYCLGGAIYHQLPDSYTFDEAVDFVSRLIEAMIDNRQKL
jgi:hypothetical protein